MAINTIDLSRKDQYGVARYTFLKYETVIASRFIIIYIRGQQFRSTKRLESYQNFWYLRACILIWISWNLYSYLKFELIITFILIIQHVWWFCRLRLFITQHTYTKHNISTNRVRTLKYLEEGWVFAPPAAVFFFVLQHLRL